MLDRWQLMVLATHAPTRTCARPSRALPTNSTPTVTIRYGCEAVCPSLRVVLATRAPTQKYVHFRHLHTANKFDMSSATPQTDAKTAAPLLRMTGATRGLSQVRALLSPAMRTSLTLIIILSNRCKIGCPPVADGTCDACSDKGHVHFCHLRCQ